MVRVCRLDAPEYTQRCVKSWVELAEIVHAGLSVPDMTGAERQRWQTVQHWMWKWEHWVTSISPCPHFPADYRVQSIAQEENYGGE